jgi:hypothetical protein
MCMACGIELIIGVSMCCTVCIDFFKGKMTASEAYRALGEVEGDEEHVEETKEFLENNFLPDFKFTKDVENAKDPI